MNARLKKYIKIFTPLAKIEKPQRNAEEIAVSARQRETANAHTRAVGRSYRKFERHCMDLTAAQVTNARKKRATGSRGSDGCSHGIDLLLGECELCAMAKRLASCPQVPIKYFASNRWRREG